MDKLIKYSREIGLMAIMILYMVFESAGQVIPARGYLRGGFGSGGAETLDVVVLDLKVFLSGPYASGKMNADLNDQGKLPLEQPYDTLPSAPWYYTGSEAVEQIPNDSVVDWILVELRDTPGDSSTATPGTMSGRQAAFLMSNGDVRALDGSSLVRFKYLTVSDNLYSVIWHRNHLPAMNRNPLAISDEVYSFDLTQDTSEIYRDNTKINTPMVSLNGGKFGLWAGNALPDYKVDFTEGSDDDALKVKAKVGTTTFAAVLEGYFIEDLNMDGLVRYTGKSSDRTVAWKTARLAPSVYIIYSHVPE